MQIWAGTAELQGHQLNMRRVIHMYSSRVLVMRITALSKVAYKNWLVTQASSHQLVLTMLVLTGFLFTAINDSNYMRHLNVQKI